MIMHEAYMKFKKWFISPFRFVVVSCSPICFFNKSVYLTNACYDSCSGDIFKNGIELCP
jgi:hypothetical protein